uniref:Uncharacterized protein n=1 Tax=Rhizophora mucronata TaxID=61149 RepID=A0A2P2QDZ3_RHIMU
MSHWTSITVLTTSLFVIGNLKSSHVLQCVNM